MRTLLCFSFSELTWRIESGLPSNPPTPAKTNPAEWEQTAQTLKIIRLLLTFFPPLVLFPSEVFAKQHMCHGCVLISYIWRDDVLFEPTGGVVGKTTVACLHAAWCNQSGASVCNTSDPADFWRWISTSSSVVLPSKRSANIKITSCVVLTHWYFLCRAKKVEEVITPQSTLHCSPAHPW